MIYNCLESSNALNVQCLGWNWCHQRRSPPNTPVWAPAHERPYFRCPSALLLESRELPQDPPVPPTARCIAGPSWLALQRGPSASSVLIWTSWEALMGFSEVCLVWDELHFSVSYSATCASFLPVGSCRFLTSDVWFSTWWWYDTSRCEDNTPVLLLLVMTNCQPLPLFLMFPQQLNSTAKAQKIGHNAGKLRKSFTRAFLFVVF